MKKVSELEGAELDYWTAKSIGLTDLRCGGCGWPLGDACKPGDCSMRPMPYPEYHQYIRDSRGELFRPSSDWSQGGPIIEREIIDISKTINYGWMARMAATKAWGKDTSIMVNGNTPLIAAMRAFVASKYGEEVDE